MTGEPTLARFEWDKANTRDVDAMEWTFRDQTSKGRRFYAVTKTGRLGKRLTKFDASLGRMVLKPRMTNWERLREAAR